MTYWIREGEFHSKYKGYDIIKVKQDSGRVTYDAYLDSEVVFQGEETLKLTKLNIDVLKGDLK